MTDMLERAPGIYEIVLHISSENISEIKIFLIPGKDGNRSLMIDAGFRSRACLKVMEQAMADLGITFDKLDVFLTHKHHDHCGLASEYAKRGARLFMNPQEDRHCYDCLYYNHSHGSGGNQPEVLRSTGVTAEGTPEIWEMFMEVNRRVEEHKGWEFEILGFSYTPVREGEILSYGGYEFEVVPLKGHTFGQLGLYDKKRRVIFCADQVIDGIVPIVGTSYADEHLLKGYFASLEHFKQEYAGCLVLPAHKDPIRDVKRVVDRIVFSYIDKADMIKQILDHSHRPMTTKQVACLAYGMKNVPKDKAEFIKLKMIISKTFSCLEYLYDEDFAIRNNAGGIYYWESP